MFSQIFLQILDNLGQTFLRNNLKIFRIINKKTVRFLYIFVAIFLAHLDDHNLKKFLKVNFSLIEFGVFLPVSQIPDEIADLLITRIES